MVYYIYGVILVGNRNMNIYNYILCGVVLAVGSVHASNMATLEFVEATGPVLGTIQAQIPEDKVADFSKIEVPTLTGEEPDSAAGNTTASFEAIIARTEDNPTLTWVTPASEVTPEPLVITAVEREVFHNIAGKGPNTPEVIIEGVPNEELYIGGDNHSYAGPKMTLNAAPEQTVHVQGRDAVPDSDLVVIAKNLCINTAVIPDAKKWDLSSPTVRHMDIAEKLHVSKHADLIF